MIDQYTYGQCLSCGITTWLSFGRCAKCNIENNDIPDLLKDIFK